MILDILVNIVTGSHNGLESLIIVIISASKDVHRLSAFIPINAKKAPTLIFFDLLHEFLLIWYDFIKLCILFFCTFMMGQEMFVIFAIQPSKQADIPLDELGAIL